MRSPALRCFILTALVCVVSFGVGADTRTISGSARRIVSGSALPTICAEGDVWYKTAATKGGYLCTAPSSWSALATVAATLGATGSSTDNALVRWDGTAGSTVQNSVLTSADWSGDLAGPSALSTTTSAGLAYTNQPANDAIEVLSSDALDITQSVTIIGTTTGTDTVVVETVSLDPLDGTTPVATTKVDWGVVLAVKLSAACAGTVTVREASGGLTIAALAPAASSSGVEAVLTANQPAWSRTVSLASDGATTKQLGLQGTNTAGTVIYDSQALAGTTAVLSNATFAIVTEIYTGDLEGARTATETATPGTRLDGAFILTGSFGTCTLDGGATATCTASVSSGCTPICSYVSSVAAHAVSCAVAGTTLTAISGTTLDAGIVAYACF